jgi:hypothetical protein
MIINNKQIYTLKDNKKLLYKDLNQMLETKKNAILKEIINKPYLTDKALYIVLDNYLVKKDVALNGDTDKKEKHFGLEAKKRGVTVEEYSNFIIQKAIELETIKEELFILMEISRQVIERNIELVIDENSFIKCKSIMNEMNSIRLDRTKKDLGLADIKKKIEKML